MAKKNITTENDASVTAHLDKIEDEGKRNDCIEIAKLMQKTTGLKPHMWGTAIIGFGTYHYKYASGHEGDAPLAAFAARANSIVLYLAASAEDRAEFLKNLGKHKPSKGCIHIKKLADIDTNVLSKMVANAVKYMKEMYP